MLKVCVSLVFCTGIVVSGLSETQEEGKTKRLQAEIQRLRNAVTFTEPYVAYINVNGALGEEQFTEAVANVNQNIVPVRTGIKTIKTLPNVTSLTHPKCTFDKWAKLSVFLVNDAALPAIIAVPGVCSVINLHGLDADNPAPEKRERRVKQTVLRGLGYACGAGANIDARCVMYMGATTLKGLDAASVSFSPLAFGPVQDCLQKVGGSELMLTQ